MPSSKPAPGVLDIVLIPWKPILVVVADVEVVGDQSSNLRSMSQVRRIDSERLLAWKLWSERDVEIAVVSQSSISEKRRAHRVRVAQVHTLAAPAPVGNRQSGLLVISSQRIRGICEIGNQQRVEKVSARDTVAVAAVIIHAAQVLVIVHLRPQGVLVKAVG